MSDLPGYGGEGGYGGDGGAQNSPTSGFSQPRHPLADHPLFQRPSVAPVPEPPADLLGDASGEKPGRRRTLFLTAWLTSALIVGAGTGFGILAATSTSKNTVSGLPLLASSTPSATPSPKVSSGVRPDGSHYGSVKDFLLPTPDGYSPGPDEGDLGNDAAVTPDRLDSQVSLLFGTLPPSDMTSAKGAMEAGHMKDGAVRTYVNDAGNLDIAITALQLDPALSAKSTGDFVRIVKQSSRFRAGPAVAGYPTALCVLPATRPGDKLDSMTCLATVGDTFLIDQASGLVPLDQKAVMAMFAQQLDRFKNGLGS